MSLPRRRPSAGLMMAAAAAIACTLAPAGLGGPPRLVWNATASAPLGFYGVAPGQAPAVGDWAAVMAPDPLAKWLAARGYAPRGVLLIKQVAALAPQRVCRNGGLITIDGEEAARARNVDRAGRSLPAWSGCRRLAVGEVFLLNADPQSLDGRYFGPIGADSIVGRASVLWTAPQVSHAPL